MAFLLWFHNWLLRGPPRLVVSMRVVDLAGCEEGGALVSASSGGFLFGGFFLDLRCRWRMERLGGLNFGRFWGSLHG